MKEQDLRKIRNRIINQDIFVLANATGKLYLDFYFGCISIENQDPPDLINYQEDEEIFQWFIVSDWFASHAEKNGLTILQTDDLNFWGRTCCGVAIDYTTELDGIIHDCNLLPKQEQA